MVTRICILEYVALRLLLYVIYLLYSRLQLDFNSNSNVSTFQFKFKILSNNIKSMF